MPYPRTSLRAAMLVALFLCVLPFLIAPLSEATTVNTITGSFTFADQVIDDVVYNVSSMTTSSSTSLNYITECTVQGGGLGFTAFTASVSDSTIPLFNLTMAQTKVNNASVAFSGYFPPYSTLMVSYTTATMEGTTSLFDFRNLVPENYVMLYILETTATWNEDGDGGAVLLAGGVTRQLFKDYSGMYVVNTHATNAAHILHQVLPQCSGGVHCLDIYKGLFAIDVATCTNCKGEFLRSENTVSFLTGASGGVVRIANCTSTGGQPFIGSAGKVSFQFSGVGNLIFYGLNLDGALFTSSTVAPQILSSGYLSFMHISAASVGLTGTMPYQTGSNTVWMGNITLDGTLMNSADDLLAQNISTQYFLDEYSTVLSASGNPGYMETINSSASVFCARPGISSSGFEQMDGWKRAQCNCATGTYGPYCMQVMDPVSYYVNYNAKITKEVCDVDNCAKCISMSTTQCTQCDAGFKLNSISCVAKGCSAADCSTCVFDSEQDCSVCDPGYKLDKDNITCTEKVCGIPHCNSCVFNTEDHCEQCAGGYVVSGSGCLATKVIVGVVLGLFFLLFILAILLLLYLWWCRRKAKAVHGYENVCAQSLDGGEGISRMQSTECEEPEAERCRNPLLCNPSVTEVGTIDSNATEVTLVQRGEESLLLQELANEERSDTVHGNPLAPDEPLPASAKSACVQEQQKNPEESGLLQPRQGPTVQRNVRRVRGNAKRGVVFSDVNVESMFTANNEIPEQASGL